ncbi:hypothetical protein D3C86_1539030 [compost metagenome]
MDGVQNYMTRWVKEPGSITRVTIGSEINFNKVFPRLSGARTIKDVLGDIGKLNKRMGDLERQFEASLARLR